MTADDTGSEAARRWQRVSSLLGELLDLDTTERQIRLAALAGSDPSVHDELADLLDSAGHLGNRFEVKASELIEDDFSRRSAIGPGQKVGPYRIVAEIGRGGMGTVWEAERDDDEYQKKVAIKAMPDGIISPELMRRFRTERRLLATLQHRNIAALFDSGVTADGEPWFAMEYVPGDPIARWCDIRKLGVRERVSLFMQVCAAVQYAHARLVLHRDLKPGNVMVSNDGTVKLLDFGVAKLMEPDDATGDEHTRTVLVPFTRGYASPEQRRGEQVTVASDVYSLGVLLYELLTGRRPAEQEQSDDGPVRSHVTASRAIIDRTGSHTDPIIRERARTVRGDLDSILGMALRQEPERRYQSAQELRDDLQRWLAGRTVRARPDSFGYRARMFFRRNRTAVLAAAAAVITLVAATIISIRQAEIAQRERDRALRETVRTRQVTQFIQNVLAAASPAGHGRDVTVLEAIDLTIPRIDSSFTSNPDLIGAIKNTLGATLYDMGLYDRALPLVEDALRLFSAADSGRPSRDHADALYNLAGIRYSTGMTAQAESLYHAAFDMYRRLPDTDTTALTAELNNYTMLVHHEGRHAEAESLYRATLTALERFPGRRHSAMITYVNLGTLLAEMGRYVEAEPLLAMAVDSIMTMRGERDPALAGGLQSLAGVQMFNGNLAAAEATARRSLALHINVNGENSPAAATSRRMLLNILVDTDRCAEAVVVANDILSLRGSHLGDTDLSIATALMYGGWCEARLGRIVRGVVMTREGLDLRRATFPEGHWAIAQAESFLGSTLAMSGPEHRVEALAMLEAGYIGMARELDSNHVRVRQAKRWLEEAR